MLSLPGLRSTSPQSAGLLARCCWQAAPLVFLLVALAFTELALFVAVVLLVLYCRRFVGLGLPYVGTGAYGTARWARTADLKQYGMLDPNGGLLLGRLQSRPPSLLRATYDLYTAPWDQSQEVTARFTAALFGNPFGKAPGVYANDFFSILVVSPSGGGKGVSVITPAMLSYPHSAVVHDPKGECYQLSAKHRARVHGHRIVRWDPFNVAGEGGDAFNPLATLDAQSPSVVDDALALADALVVKSGHEHDPHWNECSIVAITAFILYVTMYAPREERTLNTVVDLILDPKEFGHAVELFQDRAGALRAKFGVSPAYRALQRFGHQLSAIPEKELGSIQSSIGRHLSWTHSPLVQKALAASTFDPVELARTKTTLYLILPPDKLESHSRLTRLWLTCCSRALVRNGLQTKSPVLFMLDEIGQCSNLKILREGLTVLRGYGAKFVFILQSVGQMKEMFGEAETTARSGFDYTVCFGLRDQQSAKEMSERIGNATVLNRSKTKGWSRSGPAVWGFGMGGGGEKPTYTTTGSDTEAEVGRPLITPDEMTRSDGRTVYVIPSGKYPIRLSQARYYEDPEMAGAVARANDPDACPEPVPLEPAVPTLPGYEPAEGDTDWAAITGSPRPVVAPEDVGAIDWGAITSGRPSLPPMPAPTPEPARIKFACPCGKRFNLANHMAGKRAKCTNPRCTRTFRIPTPGARRMTRTP